MRRPGEVRIIGGQWRRSRLPVADKPGLRPTPDRIRETVFNWLGQDLTGWVVLDAFAGSGALGFEAASRGAADVRMVEADPQCCGLLQDSRTRLRAQNLHIERGDALTWMARAQPGRFDLVFLDPPFDQNLFERAVALAVPLLRAGGYLYLEAPAQWPQAPDGVREFRYLAAGAVHAHLWIKNGASA